MSTAFTSLKFLIRWWQSCRVSRERFHSPKQKFQTFTIETRQRIRKTRQNKPNVGFGTQVKREKKKDGSGVKLWISWVSKFADKSRRKRSISWWTRGNSTNGKRKLQKDISSHIFFKLLNAVNTDWTLDFFGNDQVFKDRSTFRAVDIITQFLSISHHWAPPVSDNTLISSESSVPRSSVNFTEKAKEVRRLWG